MVRSVIAVVVGVVVGGVVVGGIEALSLMAYPPPPGFDINDKEAMAKHIATLPTSAFLLVLLAWGMGPFVGGWLAAWIARRAPVVHALIVGVVFLAADVFNLVTIPHPLWFMIAAIPLSPLAAWLGSLLAGKPAQS